VTEEEVWVGDDLVRYRVAGAGEPVVLVHGLSGSSRWWVRNVPALASSHRVYLLDLPGFGTLRRVRHRFVLSDVAAWLRAWMDALDMEQAHLVGHSMGGYIALRLAAEFPERVGRLVLVAPAGVPSGRSFIGQVLPLLVAVRYSTPRGIPLVLYDALRANPAVTWRAARDLMAQDVRRNLKIRAPTLMVWGANDIIVPPTVAPLLRESIPHSRLLVLPRAGHNVMFDRPDAFNAAVLAFLAGQDVGE
jgi:pimeloyl-ACP methyl ester carboxylesterase